MSAPLAEVHAPPEIYLQHIKTFTFNASLQSYFHFLQFNCFTFAFCFTSTPIDKAMAMGIIQFSISLFGNVPCPIIYGAVIDSTCLIWETICDKQGACSLYDPDAFRHFFLGMYGGYLMLLAAFSFPFQ